MVKRRASAGRFAPGDRVRVASRPVVGHCRTPWYLRGKAGVVAEIQGTYRNPEQLAYFNRDHAWFVSYAPVENPQVAIAVLVEHGGHGGDAAAPMAKKVFEKFIEVQKQSTDKQQVKVDGESRAN